MRNVVMNSIYTMCFGMIVVFMFRGQYDNLSSGLLLIAWVLSAYIKGVHDERDRRYEQLIEIIREFGEELREDEE